VAFFTYISHSNMMSLPKKTPHLMQCLEMTQHGEAAASLLGFCRLAYLDNKVTFVKAVYAFGGPE